MTRPLLTYFGLVFATTWSLWTAGIAIRRLPDDPVLDAAAKIVFLIGTFAPGLLALALTSRVDGRSAVRALIDRVFHWRVSFRWYLFAVGYLVAIKLTVALMLRVATGAWPPFGTESWYLMVGAIMVSTWVQAGEEIGWRGYALPRLADRVGLGPASVLLGIIWAGWHLPLFFTPGASTSGQSFPLYLLQVPALSVAFAWVYWRTGGSLLLVMLLHASVNNTKDIVPSTVSGATNPFSLSTSPVAWLTVVMLWIVAAVLLVRMRGQTLSSRHSSGKHAESR